MCELQDHMTVSNDRLVAYGKDSCHQMRVEDASEAVFYDVVPLLSPMLRVTATGLVRPVRFTPEAST